MKNKQGQAFFFLIILLPVVLLLFGGIIELGLLSYHKIKTGSVTKTIIEKCYPDCDLTVVKSLYQKNNIKISSLDINMGDKMAFKLKAEAPSFLGGLMGKEYYDINLNYYITKENDKIIYQKGK